MLSVPQSLLFATSIVTLLLGLSPLLAPWGLGGVAIAQIGILAVPSVAIAYAKTNSWTRTWSLLGFRRPRMSAIVGAILVGSTFWYLSFLLVWPIAEQFLGGQEAVKHLVRATYHPFIVVSVAIVGLLPALCEELFVRGMLLRSFWQYRGRVQAVLFSALFFGVMHFSLARLLPTTLLGIVLGLSVVATNSLWPAIVIHGLNNTFALICSSDYFQPIAQVLLKYPKWLGILAAIATITGLYLIIRTANRFSTSTS